MSSMVSASRKAGKSGISAILPRPNYEGYVLMEGMNATT